MSRDQQMQNKGAARHPFRCNAEALGARTALHKATFKKNATRGPVRASNTGRFWPVVGPGLCQWMSSKGAVWGHSTGRALHGITRGKGRKNNHLQV